MEGETDDLVQMPLEEYRKYKEEQVSQTQGIPLSDLYPLSIVKIRPFQDEYEVFLYRGGNFDLQVDAIVNAANGSLMGGGGLDGIIHSKAGSLLVQECIYRYPDGCNAGEARITKGYNLPANYVIHAVGPYFYSQTENESKMLLQSVYRSIYELCEEFNITSIGVSCISCGIYSYPVHKAADISVKEVLRYIKQKGKTKKIVLCVYTEEEVQEYYRAILQHFSSNQFERNN